MNTLTTAIQGVLAEVWSDSFAATVNQALNDIEVAGEEVEKAQARHPEHNDAVWNAFRSLERPEVLFSKAETLYRAHCHELLDRVAKGDDIDFATKAEVAAALCEMTLRTRLISAAEHLYHRLFLELGFPLRGTTLSELEAQFSWDVSRQNEVFSQIARRLETKRPRNEKERNT